MGRELGCRRLDRGRPSPEGRRQRATAVRELAAKGLCELASDQLLQRLRDHDAHLSAGFHRAVAGTGADLGQAPVVWLPLSDWAEEQLRSRVYGVVEA
ncbi:hypothetical protein P3T35_008130 [Kitasatospora sp. GP30]|nr:hypothetical protein [Kitasatospora sp. GP30]